MLAYHFSKGEDWARALEYQPRAADKSAKALASREAIALYEQALETAGHLGDAVGIETLMAMHEAEASLFFVLSDFHGSRAEGERLLALARRAGDRLKEASALAGMGFASMWAHDFEPALADSRAAIEVATEVGAQHVIAASRFTTGFVYAITEPLDEAQGEPRHALTASPPAGDRLHEAFTLGYG